MVSKKTVIKIKEGPTGILYIVVNNKEEIFIPKYDLKKSNQLLQEFYYLKTKDGKKVTDYFIDRGFNWLTTTIPLLHWTVIYTYVKYEKLFLKYPQHKFQYEFKNSGRFKYYYDLRLFYLSDNSNNLIRNKYYCYSNKFKHYFCLIFNKERYF